VAAVQAGHQKRCKSFTTDLSVAFVQPLWSVAASPLAADLASKCQETVWSHLTVSQKALLLQFGCADSWLTKIALSASMLAENDCHGP